MVSAKVSMELKGTLLSIKHLAKTFYFSFFIYKAKSKDLADLVISTKMLFSNSLCWA